MSDSDRTIAVIGAGGTMGLPIARNLAKAGLEVRAWNRTRDKAVPLADDGVEVLDTAAEAAAGADALLTILADTDAVIEAMEGSDGALSGAESDALWVQSSTIGIEGIERCAAIAEDKALALVDAPVLGTKAPAEKGELVVLASGPEEAQPRCEPIFDAIGQRTMWLGEAGTGTRMKMVVNAWIVSVMEGLAETFALAEGLDLEPAQFLEAVSGGGLDLPYAQMKGKAIIEGDYEPSFKLELAAKDARLVVEAADRHGLDLPLLETVRKRMSEAAEEHGEKDMAAIYLASKSKQPAQP